MMDENAVSFEKSLKDLEEIVTKLETGACSLDEAMTLFEQGMKLSQDCSKRLETARQKIMTLSEAEEEMKSDG